MLILELNQIEVDHCLDCGGIWFDAGELELLLGEGKATQEFLRSFRQVHSHQEQPRRCPICRKTMDKVTCGPDNAILIDICPAKHGIWLDQGELDEILAAGQFDPDGKILGTLREMFGKS